MITICTATNGWVAGVNVPVGSSEIPVNGSIQCWAELLTPTNVLVQSGSTLVLGPDRVTVFDSYDWAAAWGWGMGLGLLLFGTVGIIRRAARFLHNPASRENL